MNTMTFILLSIGFLIGMPFIVYSSKTRALWFRLILLSIYAFSVFVAIQLPEWFWTKSGNPVINGIFGTAAAMLVSSHGDSAFPAFILVTFVAPALIPAASLVAICSIARRHT